MESLSSKNKNLKYLLLAINVLTKHALIKPLKDKNGKTVLNAFIEIVNESWMGHFEWAIFAHGKFKFNLFLNDL